MMAKPGVGAGERRAAGGREEGGGAGEGGLRARSSARTTSTRGQISAGGEIVQAQHPVREGQALGDVGHPQGAGIGGDDGVRAHMGREGGEHVALHREVLEHCLHDDIRAREVGEGGGDGNPAEGRFARLFGHAARLHPAAIDRGRALAHLRRPFGPRVIHLHRQAVARRVASAMPPPIMPEPITASEMGFMCPPDLKPRAVT